ncbi:MAG: TlpA family protein disulfide reductase [Planctomycetaceae bacterium]
MIRRLSIAAVLVGAVALSTGCSGPRPAHPAEGRAMGDLPIVSLDDPAMPVPTLAGKVTLLNIWGTWCPPCRRELPGLARIAGRLASEPRFQLIAISIGSGGDDANLAAETTSFLKARQMPIAAWGFGEAVAGTHFSLAYGIEGVPMTFLIGPDRRIRRVWSGYRSSDEADMAAAIVALLKEPLVESGPEGITTAPP